MTNGNPALTEPKIANILSETVTGSCHLPIEAHINREIAETAQIPEFPELSATEEHGAIKVSAPNTF